MCASIEKTVTPWAKSHSPSCRVPGEGKGSTGARNAGRSGDQAEPLLPCWLFCHVTRGDHNPFPSCQTVNAVDSFCGGFAAPNISDDPA